MIHNYPFYFLAMSVILPNMGLLFSEFLILIYKMFMNLDDKNVYEQFTMHAGAFKMAYCVWRYHLHSKSLDLSMIPMGKDFFKPLDQ